MGVIRFFDVMASETTSLIQKSRLLWYDRARGASAAHTTSTHAKSEGEGPS